MNKFSFRTLPLAIGLMICIGLGSCRQDASTAQTNLDQLVLRLIREPNNLSPLLSNNSEVNEYIFLSLCEFDPTNLELVPVLAKTLPITTVEEGKVTYSFELLPDAKWSDGKDVMAEDFVFTFKLISHPSISSGWGTLLHDIQNIIVDASNPRKFKVITNGEYFLNLEAIVTAEILPRHIYDPTGVLTAYSFDQLKDSSFVNVLVRDNPAFSKFGETYSSTAYTRDTIIGSGPYKLTKWEAGQYIVLDRVENYWGIKYPERSYLRANPKRLVFQVTPEDNTAIAQLRNGELSIMDVSNMPYEVFQELKNDSTLAQRYSFYDQPTFKSYFLLLNNESPRLSDKRVRRALAECLDVDRLNNMLEGGTARRLSSLIHPAKKEADNSLTPIPFNIVEANSLLDEAGWQDSNDDGIRDKIINGKKTELVLQFFTTGSAFSETIAAVLKEGASKAGIGIEATAKRYSLTIQENFSTGEYDIGTAQVIPDIVRDDHYSSWHSSAITDGTNYKFFRNQDADRLLETIRDTKDETTRAQAYKNLQRIIYEEQVVLFLYAPNSRFIISKELKPLLSIKRPGYFANAFEALD
jgi:peptide/nickel transport system substrate-binding protein